MGSETNMPTKTDDEVRVARADLLDGLQTILRRDGESELLQLLVDLWKADQLELVYIQQGRRRIRYWQVIRDADFAARCFEIPNDVEAALVALFLKRRIAFSVEAHTLPTVVWRGLGPDVN
jgi:hypothetical protein